MNNQGGFSMNKDLKQNFNDYYNKCYMSASNANPKTLQSFLMKHELINEELCRWIDLIRWHILPNYNIDEHKPVIHDFQKFNNIKIMVEESGLKNNKFVIHQLVFSLSMYFSLPTIMNFFQTLNDDEFKNIIDTIFLFTKNSFSANINESLKTNSLIRIHVLKPELISDPIISNEQFKTFLQSSLMLNMPIEDILDECSKLSKVKLNEQITFDQ